VRRLLDDSYVWLTKGQRRTQPMAIWNDLERESPELAATGRRLLTRSGIGEALLATVRGDAAPRIHPATPTSWMATW
jgi:hypothetical protein